MLPCFFYIEGLAGIHVKVQQYVLLIFHPAIVKIKSLLLEGENKDRRMVYFNNIKEIRTRKKELTRVVN